MKKLLLPVLFFISFSLSAQWNNLNLNSSLTLIQCSFPSDDTGYVISGKIYRTFDGGLSFDSVSIPGVAQYNSIDFRTNADGVISGYLTAGGYCLFRTLNAGLNWQDITATNAVGAPMEIEFSDALHGTYVVSTSGIYNTINGGLSWDTTFFGFDMFSTIDYPTSTTGYIGGFDGTFNYFGVIGKTTDGGVTWNIATNFMQSGSIIKQVQFVSADTGFASFTPFSFPSRLIRTRDGAASWDTVYFTSGEILKFAFTDYMNGYIVNDSGSIYRTTNAGVSWTLDRAQTNGLNDINVTPSFAYAVGTGGLIIKRNLQAGIPVQEYNTELKIYPNPGVDRVSILLPHGTDVVSISAIDVAGRKCGNLSFSILNADEISVDTRSLAKGCYILEINGKNESFRIKFEKSR